ncbi:DUF4190 domain-containing protein [Micromonospora sp. WMMD1128]|uniref:DUF4190 domain-containing protein n=1 Tax=Micromonospora sp. WMMD1128 TaxID=3015150 RepID=UPI00248C841E|nr:DUF4190 domain-containing protein [Micromonospora sp. WMMD1128]WBB72972.1 DUF4190 domain-containing protein [Micromonospora sp. WMMD1128]
MTYPPPPGGWQDPAGAGPHSTPPADPYAPPDPYAVAKSPYAPPGYPSPGGDPYAVPVGYPPPYPGYVPPSRTNTLAIVALVLSLVGFTSCITAPIGAIMGHVARKQIRETGEQGEGMAKAAIIVGWILTGLLVALIIFYIVMIVIAVNSGSSSSSSSY